MPKRWHPPQRLKQPIRSALANVGFELVRLDRPDTLFVREVLRRNNINVLLDVGANQGQYAKRMRTLGFRGTIHSFEPGDEAFGLLTKHARQDEKWSVHHFALSDHEGTQKLFVSSDSVSSSLLRVAPPHLLAAPRSAIQSEESTQLETLDGTGLVTDMERAWLKLDTQGSEDKVLSGAVASLQQTFVVQTELSLVPCYDGQADYRAVISTLHDQGFRIVSVEKGTQNPSDGEMLQFDAIFERVT